MRAKATGTIYELPHFAPTRNVNGGTIEYYVHYEELVTPLEISVIIGLLEKDYEDHSRLIKKLRY